MVAPRAPSGPWVSWGRMCAVGCVWMRRLLRLITFLGCPYPVPISRDGLRPYLREQLECAFNPQSIGRKVSDFIKLSYTNMWCDWGCVCGVLTVS